MFCIRAEFCVYQDVARAGAHDAPRNVLSVAKLGRETGIEHQ